MNVRVKQKRTWRNTVLRSDRVSSRLLGAKLKRSAVAKQWKSAVRSQPVSPGLNCGSLTPVLGVMSYTTPVFGSWNTIRPCGVAELPLASPVPGTGTLAGPYSDDTTDRKNVVVGKSVALRVVFGCRRIMKKKNKQKKIRKQ